MSDIINKKVKELFGCIPTWKSYIPIGEYRYKGNPTIWESTSGEFNPSEMAILVHRYANRYMHGKYVKYQLESKNERYSTCWQYAHVLSVHHENDSTVYGHLEVDILLANTMTKERISIRSSYTIICEFISKTEFQELVKLVSIQ